MAPSSTAPFGSPGWLGHCSTFMFSFVSVFFDVVSIFSYQQRCFMRAAPINLCSFPTPGSASVDPSRPPKQLLGTSPAALPPACQAPACSSGQESDGEALPVPGECCRV